MRIVKLVSLILIAAFICFSCGNSYNESASHSGDSSLMAGNDQSFYEKGRKDLKIVEDRIVTEFAKEPGDNEKVEIYDRKLIKNGNLKFETDSLEKTYNQIKQSTLDLGGYISNENQTKQHSSNSWSVSVRVPAGEFDKLLQEISKGVKHFDQRKITTQDVTEEFVDITARLKTKKEVEQRFVKLLDKAKTIEEILDIEYKLGAIRSEIESKEGRLKYLKNQVGFSTLNINFYELNHTVAPQKGYLYKLGKAFENGWVGLGYFFLGLVSIWPMLLLFIVIAILLLRWNKKRKK